MYNLAVFISGLLFGVGLTLSNMINANKVMDFLDITGHWDPSLAFVMLGAVITTGIGYRFILKLSCPKLCDNFFLPQKKSIDARLVIGAVIFGIGWGMAGYCPGPAVSALGLHMMDAIYFVLGLIVSMFVYHLFSRFLN